VNKIASSRSVNGNEWNTIYEHMLILILLDFIVKKEKWRKIALGRVDQHIAGLEKADGSFWPNMERQGRGLQIPKVKGRSFGRTPPFCDMLHLSFD